MKACCVFITGREVELTNKPPDLLSLHREQMDQGLLVEVSILSRPLRPWRKQSIITL